MRIFGQYFRQFEVEKVRGRQVEPKSGSITVLFDLKDKNILSRNLALGLES